MSLHFSGIKSSGKVVYFSATFPYLLLITLMIYALLQDGAIDGVKKLFIVKEDEWDKLLDFNVWRQAAGQVPLLCFENLQESSYYTRVQASSVLILSPLIHYYH